MATITPTITQIDDRRLLVEWLAMAGAGDVGDWVEVSQYNTLTCVNAAGAVGNWQGVNRIGDTPLAVTMTGQLMVSNFRYVRPGPNSGDLVLFAAKRG